MTYISYNSLHNVVFRLLHKFLKIKTPADNSLRRVIDRKAFPRFYPYLYYIYVFLFITFIVVFIVATFISIGPVRSALLNSTDDFIILTHSNIVYFFGILAIFFLAAPLGTGVSFLIFKLLFPKSFQDYADLRAYAITLARVRSSDELEVQSISKGKEKDVLKNVDVEKVRKMYRPFIKVIVIMAVVGFLFYLLAINIYTRLTASGITVHQFWQVSGIEKPYSALSKAELSYTIKTYRFGTKGYTNGFFPTFVLTFNDGENVTIWDFNKRSDEKTFTKIAEFLSKNNVEFRVKTLESENIMVSSQLEYSNLITDYQKFSEILYLVYKKDHEMEISTETPPQTSPTPTPTPTSSPKPTHVQTPAKQIYWSTRRLTWNDFRGKVPPNPPGHAAIYYGVDVQWESGTRCESTGSGFRCTVRIKRVIVNTAMNPYESWVRPGYQQPDLLEHEQLHFDLAEVYARKARAASNQLLNQTETRDAPTEIAAENAAADTLGQRIDSVINPILDEENRTQEQYDAEAGHTENPAYGNNLAAWKAKITQWLQGN